MHAFCTYCSKDKRDDLSDIPAIHRYRSPRIDGVYDAALRLGVGFYILSGKFGLIPPEQPIPLYNHLLLPSEVPQLVDRVTEQVQRYGITHLVYFTQSFEQDPHVIPYHDVIVSAFSRLTLPVFVVQMGEVSLPDLRA